MDETMASPGAWNPMLAADWNVNNNTNNRRGTGNNQHHHRGGTAMDHHDAMSGRVSRLYGWLSLWGALIAICTTAQTAELATPPRPVSVLSRGWSATTTAAILASTATEEKGWKGKDNALPEKAQGNAENNKNDAASPPLPAWLRWILPLKGEDQEQQRAAAACTAEDTSTVRDFAAGDLPLFSFRFSFSAEAWMESIKGLIDPSLLQPSSHTLPDLIDKVLTSTPRLLAMANFLLSLTYLLHTAVADWFLGRPWASRPEWQHREKLGGFLVFKLLLISAVVAPDTLDLLILLSWYTLLSFLRSLAHLCANAIQHCTAAGQAPPAGVLQLLTLVWMSNILAAAVCVALFHAAGAGMVWLLTCDCALLAVDVFGHVLQHLAAVWEVTQATQLSALEEEEEARLRRLATSSTTRLPDGETAEQQAETNIVEEDSIIANQNPVTTPNQQRIQRLEESHSRRMQVLDTTIFVSQLLSHILTVAHFLHIWSLHGLQLTLIDGVLALHLHSAVSSASRQIAQRRNLNRIARHLDDVFADATELELRKHTTDVCCVCLCALSTNVKKVACGHLYHAHCLREVVERARSMETAKCPLCRASVLDGSRPGGFSSNSNDNNSRASPASAEDVGREDPTADVLQRQGHLPLPPPPPLQGPQPQQQEQQQQQALFRFSTDAILPAWVPIPNFSFEIVRRPALPPPPPAEVNGVGHPDSWVRRLLLLAGAVPMTPAEEAVAIEQLVDMFPQYDRSDLLRELRQRGSLEGVAEAVLTNRVDPVQQ